MEADCGSVAAHGRGIWWSDWYPTRSLAGSDTDPAGLVSTTHAPRLTERQKLISSRDRAWQKWPVTIITGAYIGYAVGKLLGGTLLKGKKIMFA
jgi:hypothetical protein